MRLWFYFLFIDKLAIVNRTVRFTHRILHLIRAAWLFSFRINLILIFRVNRMPVYFIHFCKHVSQTAQLERLLQPIFSKYSVNFVVRNAVKYSQIALKAHQFMFVVSCHIYFSRSSRCQLMRFSWPLLLFCFVYSLCSSFFVSFLQGETGGCGDSHRNQVRWISLKF